MWLGALDGAPVYDESALSVRGTEAGAMKEEEVCQRRVTLPGVGGPVAS